MLKRGEDSIKKQLGGLSKMKKKAIAMLLSSAMVLPVASVTSANTSVTVDVTPTTTVVEAAPVVQDELVITDLGKIDPKSYLEINPLSPVEWKDASRFLNIGVITPMATDGQNLNWDFYDVESLVWSTQLPAHRSGSINIKLVQNSGSSSAPATITYQFVSKDYSTYSSAVRVVGNISSPATSITIQNVPSGNPKPMFLLIKNSTRNSSDQSVKVRGNGYTTG